MKLLLTPLFLPIAIAAPRRIPSFLTLYKAQTQKFYGGSIDGETGLSLNNKNKTFADSVCKACPEARVEELERRPIFLIGPGLLGEKCPRGPSSAESHIKESCSSTLVFTNLAHGKEIAGARRPILNLGLHVIRVGHGRSALAGAFTEVICSGPSVLYRFAAETVQNLHLVTHPRQCIVSPKSWRINTMLLNQELDRPADRTLCKKALATTKSFCPLEPSFSHLLFQTTPW